MNKSWEGCITRRELSSDDLPYRTIFRVIIGDRYEFYTACRDREHALEKVRSMIREGVLYQVIEVGPTTNVTLPQMFLRNMERLGA